jgi:hypothetical protein
MVSLPVLRLHVGRLTVSDGHLVLAYCGGSQIMHRLTNTTRQGTPVIRISKTEARKRFYAGQAIGTTDNAYLESDPDIFHDDGTDKMMWPSYPDFDAMANEQAYYATGRVMWWGIDTPSGLKEN